MLSSNHGAVRPRPATVTAMSDDVEGGIELTENARLNGMPQGGCRDNGDFPVSNGSRATTGDADGGEEFPRREPGLMYGVEDVPSPHLSFLFGLQQVLLSISSTISIPLIVCREICAGDLDLVKSQVMSTFLFMCGVCTILQTTLGVRLPIIQGGCHKFLPAVAALMSLPAWRCPDVSGLKVGPRVIENSSTVNMSFHPQTNSTPSIDITEVWQSRMREIQGGIIVASTTQLLIGCTGIMGMLLHYIGPITIVPTITLVGLSLIDVALRFCEKHWGISGLTVFLVLLFSLYLRDVHLPLPSCSRGKGCAVIKYPVFKLLPVILAVLIAWIFCAILTVSEVLPSDPSLPQFAARTDANTDVLHTASWFFFPYPCQWGLPTVSLSSYMAMLAATITSIIESVGDYYASARISECPPPPAHAVNRGIAMEGLGSLVSGFVGSGGATTSYSQNVGAIGFTKVASRRAFQAAGLIFILCGICGKFGAILTMLPDPVLGGIVLISFGMVTSVGLSTLQFVDLNSSRNLCIIGTSSLLGLMLPRYINRNPGAISTGVSELDRVFTVLLSTAMFVGGVLGFILDNTVPGTDEERGVLKWRKSTQSVHPLDEGKLSATTTYDLPFVTPWLRRRKWASRLPFLPSYKFQPSQSTKCCSTCRKSASGP